jgi:hypothetical protein
LPEHKAEESRGPLGLGHCIRTLNHHDQPSQLRNATPIMPVSFFCGIEPCMCNTVLDFPMHRGCSLVAESSRWTSPFDVQCPEALGQGGNLLPVIEIRYTVVLIEATTDWRYRQKCGRRAALAAFCCGGRRCIANCGALASVSVTLIPLCRRYVVDIANGCRYRCTRPSRPANNF